MIREDVTSKSCPRWLRTTFALTLTQTIEICSANFFLNVSPMAKRIICAKRKHHFAPAPQVQIAHIDCAQPLPPEEENDIGFAKCDVGFAKSVILFLIRESSRPLPPKRSYTQTKYACPNTTDAEVMEGEKAGAK